MAVVCTEASPMFLLHHRYSSSSLRTLYPKPPPSLRAAANWPSFLHCLYFSEGEGGLVVVVASAGLVRHHWQPAGARREVPTRCIRIVCCSRSTLARPPPKSPPIFRADYGAALAASGDCWRSHGPAPPTRGHQVHDGAIWRDSRRGPRDVRRWHLMAYCDWRAPGPNTPAARRAMPLRSGGGGVTARAGWKSV